MPQLPPELTVKRLAKHSLRIDWVAATSVPAGPVTGYSVGRLPIPPACESPTHLADVIGCATGVGHPR